MNESVWSINCMVDRGKLKYSKINLVKVHFAHHKSHTDWSGIEPRPPV